MCVARGSYSRSFQRVHVVAFLFPEGGTPVLAHTSSWSSGRVLVCAPTLGEDMDRVEPGQGAGGETEMRFLVVRLIASLMYGFIVYG